jgi:transcriptional regulator with XRE-family HTH domain
MNMKQLREKANLRTVDVASRLSIGESTVRAWEKGKSTPSFDVIKPLTELYGITFDQLHEAVMQTREEVLGGEG